MPEEATLSNEKNYTVFQFNVHIIRFTAPYSLEYYTEVKEWDKGYLVVMAKYKQNKDYWYYTDRNLGFFCRICFRAVYGGTGSKKEGREGKPDAF